MTGGSTEPSCIDLLRCPVCHAELASVDDELECRGCRHRYGLEHGIPLLFRPNEWDSSCDDVTDRMRSFYEETPFPDYENFDSVETLATKARQGRFAKLLDDQVPPGTRVLECGCGTGQLTNFLSIANRLVVGTDICLNSLTLGQRFAREHDLSRAHFVQMNLFRPAVHEGAFDLVVSNGVLHHTSNPELGFGTLARLVRPGGHLLVGLYHRYGRLITDARRRIFRLSGKRLRFLDPNLRARGFTGPRRRAWFMDQYRNPHESKHTIGEVIGWTERAGLEFVRSLPGTRPFRPTGDDVELFAAEPPGDAIERTIAELVMAASGSREGGFFVVIAQRPHDGAVPGRDDSQNKV